MTDIAALEYRRGGGSTMGDAAFRGLMNLFPSGVTVLTTCDSDNTPRGLTCTSICSVSLRPPILLACLHNYSQTLAAVLARGAFAINLLHAGGKKAAEVFATAGEDRFAGVDWQPTSSCGLPWLNADAHAVAECRVLNAIEAGDHSVVFGEVTSVATTSKRPLLYGLGEYAAWSTPGAAGAEVVPLPR